ncbi:MAG: hypothetical protein HOV81_17185, partial [Kofleriaceae bacterium]|nr:hypothetical protein [Kofleriaceae bacterium]
MRWSLLLVLAACGRVGFDPVPDALPPNLGQLDPSFGDHGIAHPSTGAQGEAWAIAVRDTGYLINGVSRPSATEAFMDVIALTETGARDPSWPGGGEQLLGPVPSSFGYGVTMRPGGGAYIVGDGNVPGQNDNFVV